MAKNIKSDSEEGQTPLNDISGLLVAVKSRRELNDLEFKNNVAAIRKYLLKNLTDRSAPFTYKWLQKVHKDMFGKVWRWAGVPRKSDLNVGVQKEQIGAEVHRLFYDLGQWELQGHPPVEIAVKIHHRLAFIHPFQNGNGRWARMVANLYLHKNKLPIVLWPEEQKIFRPQYLKALKTADNGDYSLLLKLHKEYWKSA
ncbi:MAG: mobile mystery protein B [Candidatus Omnitrophica bacterium]|nr:mobile mystery protein B [Candidatus Omnitrophota bacterium]